MSLADLGGVWVSIAWSEVAEYSLAQGSMLVLLLCGTVVFCIAMELYERLKQGYFA